MTMYLFTTALIELMMLTMMIHVLHYSGFTLRQKTWFVLTFASVMICAAAEYAVHCGYYSPKFALPLTVITVVQFSLSPLLAVFFSGALGLYDEAKRSLRYFSAGVLVQIVCAPFKLIFGFNEAGYFRGRLFFVYEAFYFIGLIYLIISMTVVGKRFRHRDAPTLVFMALTLGTGVFIMTVANIHIAYISIGISASLCYIYYNDLVQQDVQAELIAEQEKITDIQTSTISGLANLIESRDTETGGHVARTCDYVKEIAEKAREKGLYASEIDDGFISALYALAPMHDIGKIVVPDRILRKPGKLTPEEYELMKKHAEAGGDVVRQMLEGVTDEEYVRFASDVASCHHEKWDGTGYPRGLSGEEIPLCARIMAIADVYDALVSERCYKTAVPPEDALRIIKSESGTHFDPLLADAFIESRGERIRKGGERA
ncbi:MAG: HD domain-containing protein [Clostridia bacterium]|nr:HD domain-containing protein [Clostridia bacterium]